MSQEKRAQDILEDNMSKNTLEHLKKLNNLIPWIVEAMVEFHYAESKLENEKLNENRNWFEKLPLHWRYLSYLFCGILLGSFITSIYVVSIIIAIIVLGAALYAGNELLKMYSEK